MDTTVKPVADHLPAKITGQFNITLTEHKFQMLHDRVSKIVYNEDNLDEIKTLLGDIRKIEKAIEETHSKGKAIAWKECTDWDKGKKAFLLMAEAVKSKPQTEYTRMCNEIADRQRKQEQEEQRVKNIKAGIENNALNFSSQIANCTSSDQLSYIERMINLEKGKKDKYAEFLSLAVERYNELNAQVKTQKDSLREMERLEQEKADAILKNDEAKIMELDDKMEVTSNKIETAKIVIQETAINQTISDHAPAARVVFPTVSARRTTWKFEMVNEKEVMKKSPELLVVSLNDDAVKSVLKTLKDTNQLEGKTEMTVNGIRYFEQKTY